MWAACQMWRMRVKPWPWDPSQFYFLCPWWVGWTGPSHLDEELYRFVVLADLNDIPRGL